MEEIHDSLAQPQIPIIPPQPPIPPVQTPPVPGPAPEIPPVPTKMEGLPVRSEGDRVYLLFGGKKRWFMNAEAFKNAGFKFGDEVKLDQATLSIIPEGEPIR